MHVVNSCINMYNVHTQMYNGRFGNSHFQFHIICMYKCSSEYHLKGRTEMFKLTCKNLLISHLSASLLPSHHEHVHVVMYV